MERTLHHWFKKPEDDSPFNMIGTDLALFADSVDELPKFTYSSSSPSGGRHNDLHMKDSP